MPLLLLSLTAKVGELKLATSTLCICSAWLTHYHVTCSKHSEWWFFPFVDRQLVRKAANTWATSSIDAIGRTADKQVQLDRLRPVLTEIVSGLLCSGGQDILSADSQLEVKKMIDSYLTEDTMTDNTRPYGTANYKKFLTRIRDALPDETDVSAMGSASQDTGV